MAVRARRGQGVAGTSAIRCRCVRSRAAVGLVGVVLLTEQLEVLAGGRPTRVELLSVVGLESSSPFAAGDDASSVSGPDGVVDGLLAVAGHGGVGSDVDEVVDQDVDEGFGQDPADPVDIDRPDPDDLAGLPGGGVAPLQRHPVDQHAHVPLHPAWTQLQQLRQARGDVGIGARTGRRGVRRRSPGRAGELGRRRGPSRGGGTGRRCRGGGRGVGPGAGSEVEAGELTGRGQGREHRIGAAGVERIAYPFDAGLVEDRLGVRVDHRRHRGPLLGQEAASHPGHLIVGELRPTSQRPQSAPAVRRVLTPAGTGLDLGGPLPGVGQVMGPLRRGDQLLLGRRVDRRSTRNGVGFPQRELAVGERVRGRRTGLQPSGGVDGLAGIGDRGAVLAGQPVIGRPGLPGLGPAGVDPFRQAGLLGRQPADHPGQPLDGHHRVGTGVHRRIGPVAPLSHDLLDISQRRRSSEGGGGGAHPANVHERPFDYNRNNGNSRERSESVRPPTACRAHRSRGTNPPAGCGLDLGSDFGLRAVETSSAAVGAAFEVALLGLAGVPPSGHWRAAASSASCTASSKASKCP